MSENLDRFLRSLINKLIDYDIAELNHTTPSKRWNWLALTL